MGVTILTAEHEVRPFAGGRFVAIQAARESESRARQRAIATMASAMRRGDVDEVLDVLKALGVEVVRGH